MRNYLMGLLTIPALWLALSWMFIVYRSCRDTIRIMPHFELKDGYSRWWLAMLPVEVTVVFATYLRAQVHAWWHGYETEVRAPRR